MNQNVFWLKPVQADTPTAYSTYNSEKDSIFIAPNFLQLKKKVSDFEEGKEKILKSFIINFAWPTDFLLI
jgi:hypothetical protein